MHRKPLSGLGAAPVEARREDIPAFVPSIDTQDIFRQLIADEVRSGRLTPARRRRIVRFAARLGLSAVQTGRLITACREEALRSDDPTERYHAMRLVEPDPTRVPTPIKIALLVGAALVVDLLVLKGLW